MAFLKTLGGVVCLLFALSLVSPVLAQCPTTITPTTIPWTGPIPMTLNITPCWVDITYCTRVVSGVTQYYLCSITPHSLHACDGVNWGTEIAAVGRTFQGGPPDRNCPPGLGPCPPNPLSPVYETYITGLCWQTNLVADPNGGPDFPVSTVCPDANLCEKTYSLCCDNLGHIATYLTNTTVVNNGCDISTNPDPGGIWPVGVCYGVDACSN